jgi:transposase
MKSYSQDLRERIIGARQDGASAEEAAKRFNVCKRTVERYWKRFKQTGRCAQLQRGGYKVSRLRPHLKTLSRWIKEQSDLTLAEMLGRLRRELKIQIKQHALWHQLNNLGLSYKKNAARRRARPSRHKGGQTALAPKAALIARAQTGVP